MLSICIDAVTGQFDNSTSITTDTSYGLILARLLSSASSTAVEALIPKSQDLLRLVDADVLDDISLARVCKSFAIIASHPGVSDEDVGTLLNQLIANATYKKSKGRLLAASYLILDSVEKQITGHSNLSFDKYLANA